MELTKLLRERATDAAYSALRQAILSYGLKPGSRLNVDELAAQLGVSLTPVRGAIQRLATEGLVEIRPRSGTFVATLSLQDVEETFQIRCALECLAAELAAGRLSVQSLRSLKGVLKELKKPMRDQASRETHERLNSEFHLAILQASSNRRLLEMYSALNAHIKIARIHASEGDWNARQRQETLEHEAILAGLESGNARAATEALRTHIYRAKDALLAALRARLETEA